MGGGPPPGNGPQGPAGAPGVPLPLTGPPPHGVHGQGMPPASSGHMPPHHAMMPGQGPPSHAASPGYGHAPPAAGGGGAAAPPTSAPPAAQPQGSAPPHPPAAQTPPHGQPPPPTSSANGAPPASSPMQSLPTPGPDNLHAIQRTIDSMEEKGLQDDPRFSQLLALRARSNPQDPGKGLFTNNQLCQLK